MKLLPLTLLLVAAQVSAKILVTNGHFVQLPPRRLEGPDINDVKPLLDEAIKKYGWAAEIASPTSLMVTAKIGGKPVSFFEVSTLQTDAGQDGKPKTYLVVSNLPKKIQDSTFARFHRNKVYARQTFAAEPPVNQKFLEKYADRLFKAHERVLKNLGANEMLDNVKKLVLDQSIPNVVLIERARTAGSAVFDLVSKSGGKLVAQGVIYPVSDEYLGFALTHRDDASYFNIPVDNLKGSNPDIVRVVVDKTAKVDDKVTLEEMKTKVTEKVRSICASNVPGINQMDWRSTGFTLKFDRSGQTMNVPADQMCAFVDGEVHVHIFTAGYMQYFHVMFNSRFLREEYVMVTNKDKVDGNLDKAFQMIKEDTESARKALRGQATELKLEDLKKSLESAIGEASVDEPFTEAEKAECTNSGNKCEAKLKFPSKAATAQLAINREGWVISVTRVIPSTKVPASIQISTPQKNAGDQRPSIIQHIKDFMGSV